MIKFDIDVVTRRTAFIDVRPRKIPIVETIYKNIPYIIVNTNSFPEIEDIRYIADELYDEIVELCFNHGSVGISINPGTLNVETVVTDETILDEVAGILMDRYSKRIRTGTVCKDNPKR